MERDLWMRTDRLGFGRWAADDLALATVLWGKGYATEAARAVISYAFGTLGARRLEAGHNPANTASAHALTKLGFMRTGESFYEPTGLMHPSYELLQP